MPRYAVIVIALSAALAAAAIVALAVGQFTGNASSFPKHLSCSVGYNGPVLIGPDAPTSSNAPVSIDCTR